MEKKHLFKCIDCKIATKPIESEIVSIMLSNLKEKVNNQWNVIDNFLYIELKFSNFNKSLDFVNKIAIISNNIGHHPDITFGWGYCNIKILTHKVNGLTETDFYLAEEISNLIT